LDFVRLAPDIGIVTHTTTYPLTQANQALADLRVGRFEGAAVFVPLPTSHGIPANPLFFTIVSPSLNIKINMSSFDQTIVRY
jgi:hypothetical protein